MVSALMREDEDRVAPAGDVDRFLRTNTRAYLFVVTADGAVRGWPMTSFYRTGLLYFTTYGKAAKVSHLRAAVTASVVVATPEGAEPVAWCEVSGAVRVIEFTGEVVDRFLTLGPPAKSADAGKGISDDQRERFRQRVAGGKRVLIEVDVTSGSLGMMNGEASA